MRNFLLFFLGLVLLVASKPNPLAHDTRYFNFKEDGIRVYQLESEIPGTQEPLRQDDWLEACLVSDPELKFRLGSRVTLIVKEGVDVQTLLEAEAASVSRQIDGNIYILQCSDPLTAASLSETLSRMPEVAGCCPVMIRPRVLTGKYAPAPSDTFFGEQWNLENRDPETGQLVGPDMNIRSAWALSRGNGVTLSVVDDGIDFEHPDLGPRRSESDVHFNFTNGSDEVMPLRNDAMHGTAVAGLAAAEGNNNAGVVGVAPEAKLASWLIFSGNFFAVSDESMMDMFEFKNDEIWVQNHSWGSAVLTQLPVSAPESVGIRNAIEDGRNGKGVILVRAAGNGRQVGSNANDDGYLADHRVIPVAAIRIDGLAARFSNPGACVLVAAPSGDVEDDFSACSTDSLNIVTTDRLAGLGFNRRNLFGSSEGPDYVSGNQFTGTSASCPQISGLCALLLSINPELSYRDVQQILVISSRHLDLGDPMLQINGAGFRVSPNLGYGLPDGGLATQLASRWRNRPEMRELVYSSNTSRLVPEEGLKVVVAGEDVPLELMSFPTTAGVGLHVEGNTIAYPLVDIGEAITPVNEDLTGKAALIRRAPEDASSLDSSFFCRKIAMAADAGAELAILYNNRDADAIFTMGGVERNSIPAVMISENSGVPLSNIVRSGGAVDVSVMLDRVSYEFSVNETLMCEHVALRVDSLHPARGNLRIVVVSPSGTRSVMQSISSDDALGPRGWTYVSTHHFYERTAGIWKVLISDELSNDTGRILSVRLSVFGVPIDDADIDGLDDGWEIEHFGDLSQGPKGDDDHDGFSNVKESVLGTDPLEIDIPFELDLSPWNKELARLSWPASGAFDYEVLRGQKIDEPMEVVERLRGEFPEVSWYTELAALRTGFYRVRAVLPVAP